MIGRFIDNQTLDGAKLPPDPDQLQPLLPAGREGAPTASSGARHLPASISSKQEMIVVCKPEDSMSEYDKLWKNSVELFRSMEIPVRQLECCSGDLADLKVKSCDIEAWSPRQQKHTSRSAPAQPGRRPGPACASALRMRSTKTQLAR